MLIETVIFIFINRRLYISETLTSAVEVIYIMIDIMC